jgi:hypothetical protein
MRPFAPVSVGSVDGPQASADGKKTPERGGTEPDASRGKTLTMTNDELMQRESVRACASDLNLVMIHQDAFAADYQTTNTCSSAWRSSTLASVGKKSV